MTKPKSKAKTLEVPVNQLEIPHEFKTVRAVLEEVPGVDGVSAGVSPVTVRYLTKGNVYINLGVEEVGKVCKVERNNNSYGVTTEQLTEFCTALKTKLSGNSDGRALQSS